jgi:flagellar biogenesis protein FliO
MPKKVSKRRAWTTAQVRTLKTLAQFQPVLLLVNQAIWTLKTLARKKAHAARIAKALNRTEGATRQKAFSMGVSLESRA